MAADPLGEGRGGRSDAGGFELADGAGLGETGDGTPEEDGTLEDRSVGQAADQPRFWADATGDSGCRGGHAVKACRPAEPGNGLRRLWFRTLGLSPCLRRGTKDGREQEEAESE